MERPTHLAHLDQAKRLLQCVNRATTDALKKKILKMAQVRIKWARLAHATFLRRFSATATYECLTHKSWRGVIDCEAGVLWRTPRTYAHRQSAARAATTHLRTLQLRQQLKEVTP